MTVLAGDIGGTKTLLQLADVVAGEYRLVHHEQRYTSAEWEGLSPMVLDFLAQARARGSTAPAAACFGIAGPVNGRKARTTNLPWRLDADDLQRELSIPRIRLINDFQSVGYGIEVLNEDDLVVLQTGSESHHATRAILGAGTGLGTGLLVWQGTNYEVIASEGGHADFAPTDDEQIELLKHIRKQFAHCTWERIVSGVGIRNIHDYMLNRYPGEETAALTAARAAGDPSAAISSAAAEGNDPLAVRTMALFCRLYGAQAGNLALTGLATGGVYIAGGVAPRIIDMLKSGPFMQGFLDKEERMRSLLESMPVRVIINARAGLMGSAVAASRL
ncbi:MAG: glucokinase [Gammaproteobacteria bacterium]|jgi:glucokinase